MDGQDIHPPSIPSSTSAMPHRLATASSHKQNDGAFHTITSSHQRMRTSHQDQRTQRGNLVQYLGYAAEGPYQHNYMYSTDYPAAAAHGPSSLYYEHIPYYYQGVVPGPPAAHALPAAPPTPAAPKNCKNGNAEPIVPSNLSIPSPTTPTPTKKAAPSPTSIGDTTCTTTSVSAAAIDDSSTMPPSAKRRKRGKPEFKIVHNYHDNATMSFDAFMESHPGHKPAREFKDHMSFPRALHAMLDFVSKSGQTDIVSWSSHGRAFSIHKPEEFTKLLIPKYYQMKNYASFLRQLNIYGFKCLSKDGPDKGAHYHELFLRGNVDLSRAMGRVKVKGTRHKGANNPDDEPDFPSYPALDEEAKKAKFSPQEEATSVAKATMASDPIPVVVSLDSTERSAQGSLDEDVVIDSFFEEAFFGTGSEPSRNNNEVDMKIASVVEPKKSMSSEAKAPVDPDYVPPLPDNISDIFLSDTEL